MRSGLFAGMTRRALATRERRERSETGSWPVADEPNQLRAGPREAAAGSSRSNESRITPSLVVVNRFEKLGSTPRPAAIANHGIASGPSRPPAARMRGRSYAERLDGSAAIPTIEPRRPDDVRKLSDDRPMFVLEPRLQTKLKGWQQSSYGVKHAMKRTGILGDLISWEDGVYGTSESVFSGGA